MIRVFAWLTVVTPLLASPAFAHAFLDRADPPVGSEVTSSPHRISLHFTEGVEPVFCSVEMRDAQGAAVPVSKPHTAPGDNRTLLVAVPDLHAGRYTVTWHATSVDTHKTEGNFQFTVIH
jgi:methionine-rich copper-binding protein CopC